MANGEIDFCMRYRHNIAGGSVILATFVKTMMMMMMMMMMMDMAVVMSIMT